MCDTNIGCLVDGPDLNLLEPLPPPPAPDPSGSDKDRNRVPRAAARRQEPTTLHDAAALTNADDVAGVVEGRRSKARLLSTPPAAIAPTTRVMLKDPPLQRTGLRPMSSLREASSPQV